MSSRSVPEQPDARARGAWALAWMRDRLERVQDRSPLADRLVRGVDGYLTAQGALLSAGMTYYGFLALFPLIALALGVTATLSRIIPRLDDELREQLTRLMPTLDVDAVASASLALGLVGLGIMLYAGVRWVGALRRSLTVLSGQAPRSVPFVRGLVRDVVTLALLGAAVLVSLALSVVTQVASGYLQTLFGVESTALLRTLTLVLALATDLAIGWALYHSVPGGRLRGRRLLVTAAIAGLGFEVLKQVGALVVGAASHNVVYGTFAATVGVLLWIAYLSRWILFVGAVALVEPTDAPASQVGAAPGGEAHAGGQAPALAVPPGQDEGGGDGGEPDRGDPHPQQRGQV